MNENEGNSELKYKRSNKKSSLELNELNEMNKEALIERIKMLQAQNVQLKNILQKQTEKNAAVKVRKKMQNLKSFAKRHVLLKLYYLGWDYQGYVVQENTTNTIEYHLFQALEKCCLIDGRETSNYQRCGRTDKGVSAFCQIISIDLRSKLEEPNADNCNNEYHYPSMINRLLPGNIRCYAWAHVDSTVGARFSCTSRSYQYYFPKGNLNIELMKEGVKQLIGEHDYRNFCKMDVGNGVTKFIRNITDADIKPCFESDLNDNDYSMYKLMISANGFLWHQIRCIMTILVLIGEGKESPDIVKELLNVDAHPTKPQYKMSHHTPLTFFSNEFADTEIKWNTDERELTLIIELMRKQWAFHSIKEVMIKEMIEELARFKDKSDSKFDMENLLIGRESKTHKPLLSRTKCASLEDRIEHYVKRRKLVKITEDHEHQ